MTVGGLRLKGVTKASSAGHPLLSVVTVVFNGAARLERAIRSVLDQSYGNVEYIVVDGGSTDGTLDILREYDDRIDYWVSEPDEGIYSAMNKGIGLASGELVGILNCDDWYEPDALEVATQAYLAETDRRVVVVGCWNLVLNDISLDIKMTPSLKLQTMRFCHEALFIPKSIYDAEGPYDTRYTLCADLEMFLRLHSRGIRFRFVDSILVHYRTFGASRRHFLKAGKEQREIMRRYLTGWAYLESQFFRWKSEILTAFSTAIEHAFGEKTLRYITRTYFRAKLQLSRERR